MIIKQGEQLDKQGVYKILNLLNGNLYIGSTKMTFLKRYHHHISMLRNNKHKNAHLQNAFNKYGENNFSFEILEICSKENCLLREQYYLDNNNNLYNINPFATGIDNSQKDIIEKRRQTLLKRYASGELDYVKEILRNKIPWNKGKKYISTDHLKVPKRKKADKTSVKITFRNKCPMICVYDLNYNLLGIWWSAKDLEEWSLTKANTLPIKSRNSNGKNGFPYNYLKSTNINQSHRWNKAYKNLYFKFLIKPSYIEIYNELGINCWKAKYIDISQSAANL